MRDILFVCGITAMAVVGYFIMRRLDGFLSSHRELYCRKSDCPDQEQRR
ncbi:MAG: hypothetical protein V8Q39_01690 [Anaerovoracaceae bacterium]